MKRQELQMKSVEDLSLQNTVAVLGKLAAGTVTFAAAVTIGGLKTAAFKALEAPEGSKMGQLLDKDYRTLYAEGEAYGSKKVFDTLASFGIDVSPVSAKTTDTL